MTSHRPTFNFAALLLAVICLAAGAKKHGGAPAPAPAAKIEENLSAVQLSMRISALETLADLHPTREQLGALKKLAAGAADPQEREPATPTAKVMQPMQDLHIALAQAQDEEKINTAADQLDQAMDAEKIDLDDDVEITDTARPHAAEAAKLFTAAQLAAYIDSNSGDIRDPADIVKEALQHRNDSNDEWEAWRDGATDEIVALGAGIDTSAAKNLI